MKDQQACFQFKASFSPCTIMQIIRYDLVALEQELNAAISRAPNFFIGSPIVIDLELVKALGDLDFLKLKQILQSNGMVPVGVRGGVTNQLEAAATAGLPALTIGKLAVNDNQPKKKVKEPINPTKLITTPIRSGMQVYAKNSDLIVAASVSAGAELMADGHIHVYGPLRGRALAGVQGNLNARIFCQQLAAELISIAGYYLVKEDIQALPLPKGMVQIFLENEQVKIEEI